MLSEKNHLNVLKWIFCVIVVPAMCYKLKRNYLCYSFSLQQEKLLDLTSDFSCGQLAHYWQCDDSFPCVHKIKTFETKFKKYIVIVL